MDIIVSFPPHMGHHRAMISCAGRDSREFLGRRRGSGWIAECGEARGSGSWLSWPEWNQWPPRKPEPPHKTLEDIAATASPGRPQRKVADTGAFQEDNASAAREEPPR